MSPGLSHGLLVLLFLLGTLSPREYCLSERLDSVVDSFCVSSGIHDRFYYSLGEDFIKSKIHTKGFVRTHNGVHDGTLTPLAASMFAKFYAIKIGDRFLSGYLAAKFWLHRGGIFGGTTFRLLYVQMEDENTNAIGEFLRTPPCTDPMIKPEKVSPLFFTPCSQANPSDNQVSNAFTYVYPDTMMENKDVMSAIQGDLENKKIHENLFVFWKFSHTSCNKPEKIRMRAYVTNDHQRKEEPDGHYGVYRSKWVHPNWFGAADIIQPYEKNCTLVEIAYSENKPIPPRVDIPWINRVDQTPTHGDNDPSWTMKYCKPIYHKLGWDYYKDMNRGFEYANDNAGVRDLSDLKKTPSFAGRCKERQVGGVVGESVRSSYVHDCSAGVNANETFAKYSEYLEKRKSCIQVRDCLCQCRDTIDVYALGEGRPECRGYIPKPKAGAPPGSILYLGYETKGPAGVSVMKGRKAHGIVMTLISMTFVPISIMISRYFKETWLPRAHLQIVQVWYMVHVFAAFFTICLYIFGMIAMWRSRILLGHSFATAAVYHRLLGQFTIFLFVLVIVLGPLRPTTNSPFRMIIMMAHALLGILYYFLGLITVVLSQWIPGSPSADDTTCIYLTETFLAKSTYRVLPLVAAWLIIDVLFHILFTVLQCMLDTRAGYKRKMLIPLLSILKGGEEKSTKGSKLRTVLFIIYCVLNVAITFTLIGFMIGSKDAGCGFGPTTCIHSDISTFLPADICNI